MNHAVTYQYYQYLKKERRRDNKQKRTNQFLLPIAMLFHAQPVIPRHA